MVKIWLKLAHSVQIVFFYNFCTGRPGLIFLLPKKFFKSKKNHFFVKMLKYRKKPEICYFSFKNMIKINPQRPKVLFLLISKLVL